MQCISLRAALASCLTLCLVSGAVADERLKGFPPDSDPIVPLLAPEDGVPQDWASSTGQADEFAPREPLQVVVYPLADMVWDGEPVAEPVKPMLLETSPIPVTSHTSRPTAAQQAAENLAELSHILQSLIAPEEWDLAGGQNQIAVHPRTLSLVIRATPSVHRELCDLLVQMRRSENAEVELRWQSLLPLTEAEDDAYLAAFARFASQFRQPVDATTAEQRVNELKPLFKLLPELSLRLRSGKTAQFGHIYVTAIISPDRRDVRLFLKVPAQTSADQPFQFYCRIPDQKTILLPSNWNGAIDRSLSILSAEIMVPEEEESLIPQVDQPVAELATESPEAARK